jgi:hypothetical protein
MAWEWVVACGGAGDGRRKENLHTVKQEIGCETSSGPKAEHGNTVEHSYT